MNGNATVLIALGYNELQIPCIFFDNMEEGKAWCAAQGLTSTHPQGDGEVYYNKLNGEDVDRALDEVDPHTEERELARRFFTHYYGGCGECYGFRLQEVALGTPFLAFDLD